LTDPHAGTDGPIGSDVGEEAVTMSTGPDAGVTVLDASACWQLLRSTEVGRLAVAVADHPDIFPINFLVDRATIVFRTAEGSKLAAVVISPIVAFEADGYDADVGEAWSVVLKGRAQEIKNLYELVETATFPLFPWQAGPKHRVVRIVPEVISGRRFHIVDPSSQRTPFTDARRSPAE
jgi:nitroimidazol reductase NimA-like FMN-containing flavoprotein (pyridoxamine 5'-phosphate oxidase superfamily)